MTVRELRDKLARFDDQTHVVVYSEDADHQTLFAIDDLALAIGDRRGAHACLEYSPPIDAIVTATN
jgi:hypothetical protein